MRRSASRGFTLVEIIIVLCVIGVLAAISIPLVLRLKVEGHEASAISSLRAIHDAQEVFRLLCGKGKMYATTLPQLGAAEALTRDLSDAPIVVKSGYLITIIATPVPEVLDSCTNTAMTAHWYAAAVPQQPGLSGRDAFATAENADIWKDTTGKPPAEPFQASGTISRLEIGR